MKCDELESEQWLDYSGEPMPCYPKAKADAAIAELKAKLDELSFDKKLLEGHWKDEKIGREVASRNCIELRNENAKLLSKIESLKAGHRRGIAKLNSENERLKKCEIWMKQHFYCEEVIACESAKNRRLKRALWISRAKRAMEKIAWFKLWNSSISTMNPEDGARQEFDKWKKALGKFLAKAKEYK